MGLMRSLFSGVSGLRNHQLYMDVIGNNIANVSTHGFKVGRVGFSEVFAQTLKGTTQPLSDRGGTNPIQVGLGLSVTSIDTIFSQGNLESTGQVTDLAIQGEGFFVVSDGNQRFYTRAGGFQFNADDTLIMPGSGMKLQGFLADEEGVIQPGTSISDMTLPVNRKIAANPTSLVELAGNLDASVDPLGTILQTGGLYGIEEAGDNSDVEALYASGTANGIISGMIPNSTTVTMTDGTGNTETYIYVESDSGVDGAFNSLDDLIAEINNDFGAAGYNTLQAALNSATGQLQLTDLSGAANNVTVESDNVILNQAFSALNGDANAATLNSDEFSHVAREDDTLTALRDNTGTSLGLTATDIITINGNVGGTGVTPSGLTVAATDTYLDFANLVETTLGLTNTDGAEINADDGSLIINGDGGTTYELTNMNIVATDAGGTASRAVFDAVFDAATDNWTQNQEAEDVQQSATVTVYDSLGNDFDVSFIFTKDVLQTNHWTWEVQAPEPATITGGDTGSVTFNDDGSLLRFQYDDGNSSVLVDPGSGAGSLSVNLDIGELNGFEGITQMSGANSSTLIGAQDGYGMGVLNLINIDEQGNLTGTFSNGVIQRMGQIVMAHFTNPGGLMRSNDNLFSMSGNSGDPVLTAAGDGINSAIVSGALEQSNVDLAEEFTKMIIAQRAFQANARTITVSDEMLSEVTNLKR